MSQKEKIDRELYPLDEARRLLGGISAASLYRWAAQGKIKLTRLAGRSFVPRVEIERLTNEGIDIKAA